MSGCLCESCVLPAPVEHIWKLIRPFDFKFMETIIQEVQVQDPENFRLGQVVYLARTNSPFLRLHLFITYMFLHPKSMRRTWRVDPTLCRLDRRVWPFTAAKRKSI